jgi:hypothetical protein
VRGVDGEVLAVAAGDSDHAERSFRSGGVADHGGAGHGLPTIGPARARL